MEKQIVEKLSKCEKNAIGRIVGLIAELANVQDANESYDFELDSRNGFLVVKKWKLVRCRGGSELDIVAKYMWKPGINRSEMGYTSLKDMQKWLQAEKGVHTEADLEIRKERAE